MLIKYHKYHALENDFLVVDSKDVSLSRRRLSRLATLICERRTGVGADGVLYLSPSKKADLKIDVYNADGSWAEKSGNGLRIAGVHVYRGKRRSTGPGCSFETGSSIDSVRVGRKIRRGFMVTAGLGQPDFDTAAVPVKSRLRYMINSPLRIGGVKLPVTCLSVGNPHTVVIVNDFNFDWQILGSELEHHRAFPNRTNVEFVRVAGRQRLEVADWERGAGATGSSGTGAAAAVCAGVTMGLVDRKCEVVFENGSVFVEWQEKDNEILLTGPVEYIGAGGYEFK